MSYQDTLVRHLVEYKASHLGGPGPGVYRYRGRDVSREHILPIKKKWLNLLEEHRGEIQGFLSANRRIKLHRYFHHLNSSQAFALNLFEPFYEGGVVGSTALLRAFGQDSTLTHWEPEAIPDEAEETNIDVLWDTADGVRTFCEVKLSERDFGKAALDERHLRKLREIYLPRLGPHLDGAAQRPAVFLASYQVLRNVWHMLGAKTGRLVFLLPRANAALWPLLDLGLSGVSPTVRGRVAAVAIEDLLDVLSADVRCPQQLKAYVSSIRRKYVPKDRAT